MSEAPMKLNSDKTRIPKKEWQMIQDAIKNKATINIDLTKKLVAHQNELEMDLALLKKCLREGTKPENLGKEPPKKDPPAPPPKEPPKQDPPAGSGPGIKAQVIGGE